MKKIKCGAVISLALGTLMLFTACGGAVSSKIDFYSGSTVGDDGKIVFNEKLFYMNEDKGPGPDPFVLDDTERSGYYYIGSTQGEFVLYRSKDMMTIEAVGPSLDLAKGSDQANAAYQDRWAPEYILMRTTGVIICSSVQRRRTTEVIRQGKESYPERENMYPISPALLRPKVRMR